MLSAERGYQVDLFHFMMSSSSGLVFSIPFSSFSLPSLSLLNKTDIPPPPAHAHTKTTTITVPTPHLRLFFCHQLHASNRSFSLTKTRYTCKFCSQLEEASDETLTPKISRSPLIHLLTARHSIPNSSSSAPQLLSVLYKDLCTLS
ncbi:hypothetical protein T439DRAFT_107421 [Meredithblackwellia eburnea MCA 4105]